MSKSLTALTALFDNGAFNALNSSVNEGEVCCVNGKINGENAYAFYIDDSAFDFSSCKRIIKLYELAAETGSPIVGFYSSPGVSLNDGFASLSEYSALLDKAFSVSGVIPQISIISGECLGVAALMSNTADVVIGVEGCDYYINSNSDNKTETSFKGGVIDILAKSIDEAVNNAKAVLSLLPQNNLSPLKTAEYTEGNTFLDDGSVIELKADYSDNVKTCLATVGGIPAGIIDYNSNPLDIKGAYKAQQLIKLCNAYNIPIITIANSIGFDDENSSALITALTKLSSAYANATTAKISVITKESIGGAFVLLAGKGANSDITIALDGAVISPMSVSSAVAFMFDERLASGESRSALEAEYKSNNASAKEAAKSGAVDIVAEENSLKKIIIDTLDMLSSKRKTTIPRKHTVK